MGCNCQNEVAQEIREALHEVGHNHLAEICHNLKLLVGINQRMLQRLEESSGIPKGHTLTVSQATPSQNTIYSTSQSDVNGTAQGFLITGPGNVSLYSVVETEVGGQSLIATVPSNGFPVFIPFWHGVKIGGKFGVATDSGTPSILTLATWIEPVGLTGDQFFQLRR